MYNIATKTKRAEFRRKRKIRETTLSLIKVSESVFALCLLLMMVSIFLIIMHTQQYAKCLEDAYHINEFSYSPRTMTVEEEFQKYIDSLPLPEPPKVEFEETSKQVETKELSISKTKNELELKCSGIVPTKCNLNTSAYCSCEQCCGKTDGVTASGEKVRAWYTVAAGEEYAIGTIIYIPALADEPNDGWFIVQDRGGAIKNGKLDIFLNSHEEALEYGRHTLECYVYEF